jgi:hypothetical protein
MTIQEKQNFEQVVQIPRETLVIQRNLNSTNHLLLYQAIGS